MRMIDNLRIDFDFDYLFIKMMQVIGNMTVLEAADKLISWVVDLRKLINDDILTPKIMKVCRRCNVLGDFKAADKLI